MNFEFKFPAKNSEFFRFKYLNFPPKNLDSIGGGGGDSIGGGGGGGHGDNRGTSSFGHSALNQFPASFFCCLVLDGIGYTFGILLEPLMEHYSEGKGVISMVASLLNGSVALCAPIASLLVNRHGTR